MFCLWPQLPPLRCWFSGLTVLPGYVLAFCLAGCTGFLGLLCAMVLLAVCYGAAGCVLAFCLAGCTGFLGWLCAMVLLAGCVLWYVV